MQPLLRARTSPGPGVWRPAGPREGMGGKLGRRRRACRARAASSSPAMRRTQGQRSPEPQAPGLEGDDPRRQGLPAAAAAL